MPQVLLQSYMALYNINGVNESDLMISLSISFFNLVYNLYNLKKQAKFHGMAFVEYAISVLQLGVLLFVLFCFVFLFNFGRPLLFIFNFDSFVLLVCTKTGHIPIVKLVPRLPGIKRGKIKSINFSDFDIDKESLGPIVEAISSKQCNLQTMKLSIGSLHSLDHQSCNVLGEFLKKQNIDVRISHKLNRLSVLKLFNMLDKDGNGYLDEREFGFGFHAFREILSRTDDIETIHERKVEKEEEELKTAIFQRLAIRRPRKRDRVYFYDFYTHMTNYEDKYKCQGFDILQIDYPIHYVFNYLSHIADTLVEKARGKSRQDSKYAISSVIASDVIFVPTTPQELDDLFKKNLLNLYYFGVGMGFETLRMSHNLHNVLFSFMECIDVIAKASTRPSWSDFEQEMIEECHQFAFKLFF